MIVLKDNILVQSGKFANESTLVMDSSVRLIHHDLDRSWMTNPDPDP